MSIVTRPQNNRPSLKFFSLRVNTAPGARIVGDSPAGFEGYPGLWDRSEILGGVAKAAPLTERLPGYMRRMTACMKAQLLKGMAGSCSGLWHF